MIVDNTTQSTSTLFVGYFPTVFLAYLNICMNPFIYATKHDGVKQRLVHLMSICCRCKGQMAAVVGNSTNRDVNAGGTQQTRIILTASFPGKPGLTVCSFHFTSPCISNLFILLRQAKALHIILDTIPPGCFLAHPRRLVPSTFNVIQRPNL